MADLNDLMVFRLVVEQGSFTKAAAEIGLPKSNISRKVSRLETQLGARLLERSTRALHLTEIGHVYYAHCLRIAEEIDSAEQYIEAQNAEPRGWVKLCSSVTVGQSLISPLLPEFAQQYPEVHINMTLSNRRMDIIEEGFDLAIRAGESPDSNLISKKLYSATLNLYASPEYLTNMAHEPISQPLDLLKHRCIYMNAAEKKAQWHLQNNASHKHEDTILDISPQHICNDYGSIHQLALSGTGIALLPDYICSANIKENRLVRVLNSWSGNTVNIYAIYPSRKGVAPKLRALLDYLDHSFPI